MSTNDRIAERYTGADTQVIFVVDGTPTIVSTEYQELNFEASIRVEEKTAGNERDATFNATIREAKWDFKVFDLGELGIKLGLNRLFFEGVQGDLYIYPKGQISGKPVIAFPFIVTGVKHPYSFDKNVMNEVSGIKNGAYIKEPYSLV